MQLSSFLASLLMVLPFVNARPATAGDAQWEDLEDVEELDRRNAFSEDAEFEFQPFSLTDVCLDCSRPDAQDLYACVLKFEWSDPNSVRENNVSSCTCVSNWTWDGVTTASGEKNTYDTQYAICAEDESTYFEMKFVGFDSAENFTLEIAHHYKDDQNFTAPWDYPTTWAQPEIQLPNYVQTENAMTYFDAGPIYAPIVGISD